MKDRHLPDEKISAFFDGEILPDTERKHLEICPLCSKKFESYKLISSTLSNLKPKSSKLTLTEEIKLAISKKPPHITSLSWTPKPSFLTYALFATLAILLIISSLYTLILHKQNSIGKDGFVNLTNVSENKPFSNYESISNPSNVLYTDYPEDTVALLIALTYENELEDYKKELFNLEGITDVALSDVVLSLGDEIGLLEEY